MHSKNSGVTNEQRVLMTLHAETKPLGSSLARMRIVWEILIILDMSKLITG